MTSPVPRVYDRMARMGNHGPPEPWTLDGWESYLSRGAVLAHVQGFFDTVRHPKPHPLHCADRMVAAIRAWRDAGHDPEDHPVVAAIRAAHSLSPSERAVDVAVGVMYALPEWRAVYDPA